MIEAIIGVIALLILALGRFAIKKPIKGKKLVDIISWIFAVVGGIILAVLLGYYIGATRISEFTTKEDIKKIQDTAKGIMYWGLGIYAGFGLTMSIIKWLSSLLNEPDKENNAKIKSK